MDESQWAKLSKPEMINLLIKAWPSVLDNGVQEFLHLTGRRGKVLPQVARKVTEGMPAGSGYENVGTEATPVWVEQHDGQMLVQCLVAIALLNHREIDKKIAKRFEGANLRHLVGICLDAVDGRNAARAALFGLIIGAEAGTVDHWKDALLAKLGKAVLSGLKSRRRKAESEADARYKEIRHRAVEVSRGCPQLSLSKVRERLVDEFAELHPDERGYSHRSIKRATTTKGLKRRNSKKFS